MADQKYKVHPYANLFPPMSEAEFQALKADIKENGQQEDIAFWRGQLVDGRHRLRACQELGIQYEAVDWECDEDIILARIIGKNLHRRHLTESQRAMVAAKLATMKHGGDRKSDQESNCTLEKASSTMKVSKDSTKRAKKVIQKGSAKVTQAVEKGELPVSVAAELVDAVPDKEQQDTVVAGGKDEVRRVLKKKAKKPKSFGSKLTQDDKIQSTPISSKDPQSYEYARQMVYVLKTVWGRVSFDLKHWEKELNEARENEIWINHKPSYKSLEELLSNELELSRSNLEHECERLSKSTQDERTGA